jgi:hypothetical protein
MNDTEYWNNEFEKTKRFLELCSPEVHDYVTRQVGLYIKAHPTSPPTKERQDRWDRFIASNPILQRVIYYTYSPAEAIDLRNNMLLATDVDLGDDGWYIDFALRDPDFPNDALLRDFLEKMKFDMDRVTSADNWKREGAKESIEELRNRAARKEIYEDEKGYKITRVHYQSPTYRDEIITKRHPDGTITEEYHTHNLGPDEPDTSGFIDETLMRWMKLFEDVDDLRESAFYSDDHVYVHDSSGKVVNKIPLGMADKYKPLIKATPRLEADDDSIRDKMRLHWDLEQIFRKAIMSWDGKIPPPAYFKRALRWGFLNLEESFRKKVITDKDSLIECEDCGVSFRFSESNVEECPFCESPIDPQTLREAKEIKTFVRKEDLNFGGGYLDEFVENKDGEEVRKVDLLQGEDGVSSIHFDPFCPKAFSPPKDYSQLMKEQNKRINEQEDQVLEAKILRLIDDHDHPVDKALLIDFYDYYCHDRELTSNAEMSRLLKERGIKEMTSQGIGKHRKKIYRTLLQEFFPSNS